MTYEKVERELGAVWPAKDQELKEGDFVEGNLKEVRAGEYGNNYVLEKVSINGEKSVEDLLVWGKTILHTKMDGIEVGSKIKIEYLGKIETGTGRMAQNYDVFVDK